MRGVALDKGDKVKLNGACGRARAVRLILYRREKLPRK